MALLSAASISYGQTVSTVVGATNQITPTTPTSGAVTVGLANPATFPGKINTKTTGSTAPLNLMNVATAPSGAGSGDIFNLSNTLTFNNGTSSLPIVTTDGTTLISTRIPTMAATTTVNELSTLGPTITGSGDIAGVVSASGTGAATFSSFIASGTATGNIQLFNGTHSLTLQPASSPTSNFTLLFPLTPTAPTDTVATLTATQTLTNTTLNAPVINIPDANLTIYSSTDTTKKALFSAGKITTANTRTLYLPDTTGVLITGGEYNVPSSTTPAFDTTAGTVQRFSITGSVTSSTLDASTTPAAGQRVVFFIANATGTSYSFVWPTNVKGGSSPIAASGNTIQAFFYDFGTTNWFPEGPSVFVP